jgi:hypothetical protein
MEFRQYKFAEVLYQQIKPSFSLITIVLSISFYNKSVDGVRAHQTRRSGRNSRPISAEVALPRLQSEIKVALFLFASHSFLAHNLQPF